MKKTAHISALSEKFSVATDLGFQDLSTIKERGFRTIINLRPASELDAQLPSQHVGKIIQSFGINYHQFPIYGFEIDEPSVIRAFSQLVAQAHAPILTYCRRGNRAAYLWAMVELEKGELLPEFIFNRLQNIGIDTSVIDEYLINYKSIHVASNSSLADRSSSLSNEVIATG